MTPRRFVRAAIPAVSFELTLAFSEPCTFEAELSGLAFSCCGGTFLFAGTKIELPRPLSELRVIADRFSIELYGCGGLLLLVRSVPADAAPFFSCRLADDTELTKFALRA